MIEAISLTKQFGTTTAVSDVSFTIGAGEVVGFLGQNGAGKTTTFRMLAGTIAPSQGSVRLMGHNLSEAPLLAKRQLGYMPEIAPLYPEMTPHEYLTYRAQLGGIKRRERARAVALALKQANVGSLMGVQIAHLSKGFRRRVALADALLGQPPILLLDEPTAGLDPGQVEEVRQLIRRLAETATILVSTHILSEVEAMCSRAIVIDRGKLVAQGSLSELNRLRKGARAQIVLAAELEAARSALLPLVGELAPQFEAERGNLVRCTFESDHDSPLIQNCIQACCSRDLPVTQAGPIAAPLHEVFLHLTRGASSEGTTKKEQGTH